MDVAAEPTGRGACELCGSADIVLSFRAPDYITGVQFAVRSCRRCELAWTDPRPASMDRFYPPAYRKYGGATLRILRRLYDWRVRGWVRRLPRAGRALEIGCGDGWMLAALRDHGWRVAGCERSIDAARFAAAANRIPMFVGEASALGRSSRLDLIVLFQALEHLTEPFATLEAYAVLLAPGGSIVVAVPNFGSWQARIFGRSWFHLDVPRHLHHFSPASLRYAFERVGLTVTRTGFVSPEHDPYGWVQSALNRMGFEQNLLTKRLMGMPGAGGPSVALMLVVAACLTPIAVGLAIASWVLGAGAIMEMWATRE